VLPELDSLPEYEDIYYQYYTENVDYTDTMLLVVTYDQETYETEKNGLDQAYAFFGHIAYDEHTNEAVLTEYEFTIGTYDFRVVDGGAYPKYFGMIATSDEKKSIEYLYFYNQSLDYIGGQPMADFVQRRFPYNWQADDPSASA
jgi:hypothetical protein